MSLFTTGDPDPIIPAFAQVTPLTFQPSAFTLRLYNRLPECYRTADAQLGQPLLAFLGGIGDTLGEVEYLYDKFKYVDPTKGGPSSGLHSTSDLVDPATADPAWFSWLAQLLNVPLDVQGSTDTQRRQLLNASSSYKQGTVAAITAAAQQFLTGTKTVIVVPNSPVNDQWHYTVQVYSKEIQGQTYGAIQAQYPTYQQLMNQFPNYNGYAAANSEIQAIIATQNPAGMIQTFTILYYPTYARVQTLYPTYSGLLSAQPTYGALANVV